MLYKKIDELFLRLDIPLTKKKDLQSLKTICKLWKDNYNRKEIFTEVTMTNEKSEVCMFVILISESLNK